MERGRIKCGQYWETDESGLCEYDNFRIRTTHVDSNEDYTVTTLELTNLKVSFGSPLGFYSHILILQFFFIARLMKREA